ncbi:anosmin-1-like isoform X2 [Ptychodera flava]|uniref:anosmin-1-like isoform X2 n=1 Tax=Ptychodera flava TaxID=63121 RepID=UPI003969C01E
MADCQYLVFAVFLVFPACYAQFSMDEAILQARCKSRCLTLHSHRLQGVSHPSCEKDVKCASCLRPCQSMYKNLSTCMSKCESLDEDECFSSCESVKTMHKNKPGECPHPDSARDFAAACVEECTEDVGCDGDFKCCSNGCGHTCQEPEQPIPGRPALPASHPMVINRENQQSFIVTWHKSPSGNSSDIIVYSLEMRGNIGEHASHSEMWDWETVAQTTDDVVTVRNIKPGRWYEFRVAAVNENGTSGFTSASVPITLDKDPEPPGMPRNITQGKSEVSGGRVHTYVMWEDPKHSDLPIDRFRVYYSQRLSQVSSVYVQLQEHRKNVPGNQHHIKLENLHSDTQYFVQVQAFSMWGKKRLRSVRSDKTITTPTIAQAGRKLIICGSGTNCRIILSTDEAPVHKPWATNGQIKFNSPGPLEGVTVEMPYWHHDDLKARVHWGQPMSGGKTNRFMIYWGTNTCIGSQLPAVHDATSHDKFFDIYGLEFNCKYEVKIQPAGANGALGPESVVHFFTPNCSTVRVKGRQKPNCSTPEPNILPKPKGVSYIFVVAENVPNVTGQFHWQAPDVPSSVQISGYKVSWAEKMPTPAGLQGYEGFPVIDRRTENSRYLPDDAFSFSVRNLRAGTQYVFQVQAYGTTGNGEVAMKEFKTPAVQQPPFPGESRPRNPTFVTSSIVNSNVDGTDIELETITVPHPQKGKKKVTSRQQSGLSAAESLRTSMWTFVMLVACIIALS